MVLYQVLEEGEYSHLVLGRVLKAEAQAEKRDRKNALSASGSPTARSSTPQNVTDSRRAEDKRKMAQDGAAAPSQ